MPMLRLRAHHLCCTPFADFEFAERGPDFINKEREVKKALLSDLDTMVTIIEGPDQVCQLCANLGDNRCASANGNEEQVRKWDAILRSYLGVPFNTCLSVREWQSLIKSKTPFKICPRCRWQSTCEMGKK